MLYFLRMGKCLPSCCFGSEEVVLSFSDGVDDTID